MPILVIAEAIPKLGAVETLVQALGRGLPATREAEGCHGIRAYLEPESQAVVAVETWESRAHYESYLAWRVESGAMAALESLLEEPLKIRYFNALDV